MMYERVIVDTSALVAFINRGDSYHEWVTEQLKNIKPPLITCEAVISEAYFLLQRARRGTDVLRQLLRRRQVEIQFDLGSELSSVVMLLERYQSVPASLADVELVRMSELYPNSYVFTLDSDFQIYRKDRDVAIPLIFPELQS